MMPYKINPLILVDPKEVNSPCNCYECGKQYIVGEGVVWVSTTFILDKNNEPEYHIGAFFYCSTRCLLTDLVPYGNT